MSDRERIKIRNIPSPKKGGQNPNPFPPSKAWRQLCFDIDDLPLDEALLVRQKPALIEYLGTGKAFVSNLRYYVNNHYDWKGYVVVVIKRTLKSGEIVAFIKREEEDFG